jgi:hypothetical protein
MREVNFLREKDKGRGKVDFVDIDDPAYSSAQNAGLDYETAMNEIHALLPDGTVLTKVRCKIFIFSSLRETVFWRVCMICEFH